MGTGEIELQQETKRIERVIKEVADFSPEQFDYPRLAKLLGWVSLRSYLAEADRLGRAVWSVQQIDARKKSQNTGVGTEFFGVGRYMYRLGGYAWIDSPDKSHTKVTLEAIQAENAHVDSDYSVVYIAEEQVNQGKVTQRKSLVRISKSGEDPGRFSFTTVKVKGPGSHEEPDRVFCKFVPEFGAPLIGFGPVLRTFHGKPQYPFISRLNAQSFTHESFLVFTWLLAQ